MEGSFSLETKCRKVAGEGAERGAGIKRGIGSRWLARGGFFFLLLFLHLFLKTGQGDDAAFAKEAMPLGEFVAWRYRNWSSRVLIEAGVKLLAASPAWVWRMLNSFMLLLLVWITGDLFGTEDGNEKIFSQVSFFSMLLCLPALSLCDAGWIATTLNYLWPLTLGLVAARPVKHWVMGGKCSGWEYAACPVCMVYAANMEQGAAVLSGVFLLAGIYLWRTGKKLPRFYFVLVFILTASVLFILTAPGNKYRFLAEMKQWFPGYDDLGVSEKLLMGFIDSLNYYASAGGGVQTNFVFALLTGILLAGVLQNRSKRLFPAQVSVAFVPFLFYWGIGHLGNYLLQTKEFKRGGHIVGLFGKNRCLPTGAGTFDYLGWIAYSRKMVFLQAGIYLGLLVCVALTIYFLHGRSGEALLEVVILGGGLLSRVIMGLSPTIYASGERTSLYCSVAVLIVCLRNLQLFRKGRMRGKARVVLGIYIACVICMNIWLSKGAVEDCFL